MTLRCTLSLFPAPALALALAACGSSSSSPDAMPDAGRATRLDMPQISLASGEETTVCVTLPLANPTPQILRRVRSVIAPGSHHLIAYRMPAGTPTQATPTPCQPFADILGGASPVIIAESPDAELVYPSGVGLALEANQMIKLEQHFLNPADDAIQSSGHIELDLAEPDPSLIPANLLFWGPQQFEIQPHARGEANLFHLVDPGVKIFALTTHEHHYGTLATIEQATTEAGAGTELYRNTDWAHPPLKTFDPPLPFDGSAGLRVHCEWFNTSSQIVPPGLSAATNEMCFFWAYYYPSNGSHVCAHATFRGLNVDLCCPEAGATLCSLIDTAGKSPSPRPAVRPAVQ
jgi:hypothetical protein